MVVYEEINSKNAVLCHVQFVLTSRSCQLLMGMGSKPELRSIRQMNGIHSHSRLSI